MRFNNFVLILLIVNSYEGYSQSRQTDGCNFLQWDSVVYNLGVLKDTTNVTVCNRFVFTSDAGVKIDKIFIADPHLILDYPRTELETDSFYTCKVQIYTKKYWKYERTVVVYLSNGCVSRFKIVGDFRK